jgi:hypothetical protein
MRDFRALLNGVGIHNENISNHVTPDLFSGGLYLQSYDLSPCQCSGFHTHAPLDGQINLIMRFGTPLAEPVTIVRTVYDTEYLTIKYYNEILCYSL